MTRTHRPAPKALLVAATLALLTGLLWPADEAPADDRDLLRFATGKPYLFILLDTSGSMNLEIGPDNVPTVAHGDDPDSRIYAAKEALFEVFKDINDVHFGFATFNQDELRVTQQHYLYYVPLIPSGWPTTGTVGGLLNGWPRADADGLTQTLADGSVVNDVEGDAITFGRLFDPARAANGPASGPGSCGEPLDLRDADDRARLNAYPKLGRNGDEPTVIWIGESGGGSNVTRYGLRFDARQDIFTDRPGNSALRVTMEVVSTTSCTATSYTVTDKAKFELRRDPGMFEYLMVDRGVDGSNSGNTATEWTAALWPHRDAEETNACGAASSPFSGKGWDGNYDSGVTAGGTFYPDDDDFGSCSGLIVGDECSDLRPLDETVSSGYGRALDKGDMLPFDWANDNKTTFLQRLAPNWPEEDPDFGVTHHLRAGIPSLVGQTVYYQPRRAGREPIIAVGDTPLGKAINDVRCWYMGDKGTGGAQKCRNSAYFDAGWSEVACTFDSEYGCRRPFLIMITDGDDTCPGENPGADVSDMKSFTGVQTWALNLGDPKNCGSGGLHSITNRADGECVNVANQADLKQTLRDILGVIREQSRAFASAAVPSVQASADQALYISNFTPLNNKPIWDGHLNAFLKPIPLLDGKPDVTKVCDGITTTDGCFLWDVGQAILGQVDPSDFVGPDPDQRRVFFAGRETFDDVPQRVSLFEMPSLASDSDHCGKCADNPSAAECEACFDMFDGFDFNYDATVESDLESAQDKAATVVTQTLSAKSHTPLNIDGSRAGPDIEYLLGDIFHSNPLVVGTPVNVPYFARDVGNDGQDCTAGNDTGTGYRCFLLRHQYRRKIILVGSNDGQLHAFHAGRARRVVTGTDALGQDIEEIRYDVGTGEELWSFIPSDVMPSVLQLATDTAHRFTVDGTPSVADVFIDPVHTNASPPSAAERQWRTVAVGGLREGGRSYYALDITQPDEIDVDADGAFVPDIAVSESAVPGCLDVAPPLTAPSNCGPLPYPALLWEFFDTTDDSLLVGNRPSRGVAMDEDNNGVADLGETWSVPTIGRIRLCDGTACNPADPDNDGDIRDAYVAIFGGGMDPDNKSNPQTGSFLYMLEIETGKVIYKRRLTAPAGATHPVGAAVMDAAAVDADQDSYLDRIYIGTTGGYMYRVDLGYNASGAVPALASANLKALDNVTYAVERVVDAAWAPRLLFNANIDSTGSETARPRALYHRPSVLFAANLGLYGLAFGTGDREDLWTTTGDSGRFYVFIDDTDLQPSVFDESDLRQVGVTDANLNEDLFVTRALGQKGWYLVLDPDERVITNSFSLSGVTVFSSYLPDVAITTDSNCDPLDVGSTCPPVTGTCGEKSFESETRGVCAKTGASRLFVVGTTNANQFLEEDGTLSRYQAISQFVTNPFTEPGSVNRDGSGSGSNDPTSDDLSATEKNVMESLMSLFPRECKFANYRIDIKTIAADTQVQRIAAVPVCIVQKNWKEY